MNGKLYKDKYLIAVYDKNDNFITVYDNVSDKTCSNYLYRNSKKYRIYLIDCYKKHDDVFAEEDAEFIKWYNNEVRKKTDAEIAKELGISWRQYMRRKAKLRNKNKNG